VTVSRIGVGVATIIEILSIWGVYEKNGIVPEWRILWLCNGVCCIFNRKLCCCVLHRALPSRAFKNTGHFYFDFLINVRAQSIAINPH
jgi:hypothetical protein